MIDIGNNTVYLGGALPEEKGTSNGGLELLDTLENFNLNFIPGGVTPEEWATVYGPSPLLLSKAKANSLQYVKLFGGTEQRNLPEGHQQIKSLTSDGNAYIDTGFKPTNKTKIDITFSVSTAQHFLFGSRKSTSGDDQQRFVMYISSVSNTVRLNPQFANSNYAGVAQILDVNTKYNVVMDSNGVWLDGTLVQAFNSEPFTGEYNLVLFGNNTAGTISTAENTIYPTKIYEDGVLVRYYIPDNYNGTLGMYDLVNNVFYPNAGRGTFTAGANVTTPSPDTPMDIVCNNGVIKLNNVHNIATDTLGGYINKSTGAIASNAGYGYTDYIPVTAGQVFKITQRSSSTTGADGIAEYDSNKVWQSSQSINALGGTYTVPSGISYIRINFDITYQQFIIENGIYTDGTVETVEVFGSNLFDKTNTLQDGRVWTNANGGTTSLNNYYGISPIPVVGGQSYTRSGEHDGVNYFLLKDGTSYTVQDSSATITAPNNAVMWYFNNKTSTDKDTAMVVKGNSLPTTYEEYYNGGQATAERLLKVGTYQDEQSVIDGGVIRNVGVMVLDGTEDWDVHSSSAMVFNLPHKQGDASVMGFCTHFEWVSTSVSTANLNIGQCKLATASSNIIIKTIYNNTTDWKNWLATQYANGTPVIIVYPLATATTETVTGQPLTTKAGTNYATITQASLDNLELEVKYKKTK